MHSPDRAEDIKKTAATVASGDEQGEAYTASENDDDASVRPVASGSEDESEGREEARSAQLFLPLSEIGWYIAGGVI